MSCVTPSNNLYGSNYGTVCTFSCPIAGQVLAGNTRQNCSATYTSSWQPVWTGAVGGANTCTDQSNFWKSKSVCELPTAIGVDSCNVCNTLLYESFDYDPVQASRWYVVNQPSTGGPSVWSQQVLASGQSVATQTKSGMTCTAAGGTLCGSALVYMDGQEFYNYKVRMNAAFNTLSGTIGIAFHWQDANNHYEYVLNSNNQRTLRKKVNGVYISLWSSVLTVSPNFVANTFFNVEVEVRFGRITVWNEGVIVGQPVYDYTFLKGTVAVTTGASAVNPFFNFVTVQQLAAWAPLPAKARLFVNARDAHALYIDGVQQIISQGATYNGEYASAEYWVPFATTTRLAIMVQANSGRSLTNLPYLMVRAPWVGLDTGLGATSGWYCATGFDPSWVVAGYDVLGLGVSSGLFKPANVTVSRSVLGMYYSSLNTNPPGIWTDVTNQVDLQVTCVLPVMNTLSSEPTVVSTSLPQLTLMPGGPYPFDFNSWMKVEAPGYGGSASAYNNPGYPSTPGGLLTPPSGWTLDTSVVIGTQLQASDLSVQGAFNIYRYAQGFSNYTFSTSMGLCSKAYIGLVWAWQDTNNYYEYIIAYADGYHAVRKHINGVATSVVISQWAATYNVYVNVSVAMAGGSYALTVNGAVVSSGALDPFLQAGSFGFHGSNSGCGYFYATVINFWAPLAGDTGTGNLGAWTFNPRVSAASQDYVTETSGAGLTFYAFQNAAAAWIQPSRPQIPQTDQRSDWMAQVSVSEFAVPSSAGTLGIGFYFQSRDSYFEFVISSSFNSVSINRRGVGGLFVSTLCSGPVNASVTAATWRAMVVTSRSGKLYGFVDGLQVCSATDPIQLTLRTQGSVVLISNQTGAATSLFRDVRFQWIPLTSQDTGACGTATCSCANGGACSKGLSWSASSCACSPAWSGAQCSVPTFLPNATTVSGTGLVGGAVGSVLYVNVSVPVGAAVDAYTASHINVTVVQTNVFGYLVASSQALAQWGGAGTRYFVSNFTVLSTGNVTVYASFDGPASPLGGGTGVWLFQTGAGSYSASNWKVSGAGVTAPTVGNNTVQMTAQDTNNNEVQGSAATAATITATVRTTQHTQGEGEQQI